MWWDIIKLIGLPLINLFVRGKSQRAEAVQKFQAYINAKKDFSRTSGKINDEYKRQMDELKKQDKEEEPEREAQRPLAAAYTIPEIVYVEVKVKTRGRYKTDSGKPKGCTLHYTAGRSLKGREDAISCLKHLAERGLACMVMDIHGVIYKAINQGEKDVGFHAGKSEWMGKSSISRYCEGMEVCCAGKVDENGLSWFKEQYPKEDIRLIPQNKDNVEKGYYLMFTKSQEIAWLNYCLWQLDVNEEYDIDWINGHDEIAPDRKADPGGSFSMTMPEFRELLRDQSLQA